MSSIRSRRLISELKSFMNSKSAEDIALVDAQNMETWIIEVAGARHSLYENEVFRLMVDLPEEYPLESPIVKFIGDTIPMNEHVYSNGHICLSILYEEWSPASTIMSLCLSIQSMLSAAKERKRPLDNDQYVYFCSQNPKESKFIYHGKSAFSCVDEC